MRLSIVLQYWSVVQVYLQKPSRHCFGVDAEPPHWSAVVQFGFGRVSITHAPWLQYLASPQSGSVVHALTQAPLTHFGVAASVHWVSPVHAGVTGAFGSQTPFEHVNPVPQEAVVQLARHCPSAQILSAPHSLEYLQVFFCSVHAPSMQMRPFAQSVFVLHAHGPAVPPHASHLPPLHALPSPQSVFVVHSVEGPASVPGTAQMPDG